jgi:hypothetical protein
VLATDMSTPQKLPTMVTEEVVPSQSIVAV